MYPARTDVSIAMALTLALAGGGCGSSPARAPGPAARSSERPPVIVYMPFSSTTLVEVACFAPDGDCATLRAKALAGGEVGAGTERVRLTGMVEAQCANTVTTAIEYASVDEVELTRAVTFPVDAAVGIAAVPYEQRLPAHELAPLSSAIERLMAVDPAWIDVTKGGRTTPLEVVQAVRANFAGGPADDLLLAVEVSWDRSAVDDSDPDGELDDSPTVAWSGLILVPDGDSARASMLTASHEHQFHLRAHYDLDGDGVHDFVYTGTYFVGVDLGTASIVDGELVTTWVSSCAA